MHGARAPRSLAVIVGLGLVLVACSNANQSSQPSGSAPAASNNATGGTVRIAIGGSPDSLNPGDGVLSESYQLYELVYDAPIGQAADGSFAAELAKSWSVSADGLTWTMELVDNAKFHDGVPVTSADVKFSLDLYRDTAAFPYMPSYLDVFPTVDAPDPTHVVLHATHAIGNFESRMIFMYVLPKHIWEKVADPVKFDNAAMIGSGPFKLAEYKQGEFTRLVANKDYWRGAPHVDGVTFQTYTNSDARVAALTNGGVDVITEFPHTAVATLKKASNAKVVISDPGSPSIRDVFFNVTDPANCPKAQGGVCSGHPALRDVRVRQALAMATDKQQIIDVTQLGLGTPGKTLIGPGLGDFYASEVADYKFSVAAANKILDDAGYKDTNGDGIRECPTGSPCGPTGDLTFRFSYPTDLDPAPREADLLKSMWQAIGVKIVIQGLDADTLTSVCCPAFDYDIILWHWGSDPDPQFLLSVPTCAEISTGTSESGYCNPAYDALYTQQGIEPDHAKRVTLVHQMQQILMNDLPYLNLYYEKQLEAYRTDKFSGWYEGSPSLGLEDPTSLDVVRPVQ